MSLKEKIREAALRIGFSSVGFARAERLDDAPLVDWLLRGYQGKMHYMERDPESRLDPRKIFPECRTVISLALNYYTPHPTKSDETHGRIARYARGKDYHKVIRKKLKLLVKEIAQMAPDAKTKMCVDTTPIHEKSWAQRAGIGWQGKNSLIITRDLGSWIFLAEILTSLELEPDSPHLDFCGSCTRCIDSCPTEAIISPYVIDSNRCIAYHTIESKEEPPPEIATKSQDWIFGCDICQDVCPWNKRSVSTDIEVFQSRPENERTLESWEALSEEAFFELFAGTPLMRAGRNHMISNAAVAKKNRTEQEGAEPAKKP